MKNDSATPGTGMIRRDLLKSAALGVAVGAAPAKAGPAANRSQSEVPMQEMSIVLNVNGQDHALQLDARTTLLDALRNHLRLTGTKKGCDHGQCGACTVLVDGQTILSCLTLAAMVRAPVRTIEGLSAPDRPLHPMQQAFIDHDAFQCGFCTPGQILSAIACVERGEATSPANIREFMSGNLCRCAAYPHIVAAVEAAAPALQRS